ncbi:MAG: hypothetical protein FJX74_00070 [Armatimonadetes bacterium]|nr:hypothetical protein [Armatimonadota bacterium]
MIHILWASLAASWLCPVHADEVYSRTDAGAVVFGNEALELRFDAATGELRQMVYRPRDLVVLDNVRGLASCDLNAGGRWLSAQEPSAWRHDTHRVETLPDGAALHVESSRDGWRLQASYRLWEGKASLLRSAVFTPQVAGQGRVNGLRLVLPGLKLGRPADTTYTHLSNYPPSSVAFSELSPGRVTDEMMSSVSGHFVLLHDQQAGVALPVTYYSDQEYAHAMVIEGEGSVTVIGQQSAIVEAEPGKPIALGSQLLGVAEGDRQAGLAAGQALYDLVGLAPPQRTLEAAAKTVVYSAHPGGTIDSGFRDVGGYREFAKMLPYYADLGVNMLWLLPIWHGHVYAPDDYHSLDPRLGTEEELKALVDQAHGLGIRVLGDLIPHGPLDSSKLHEQHPDWICKNEDGSFQYWWGCLYCDYAHPGWQGFMGEHSADWVRRVGLDGYRVDCAGGGPPNWRPYADNRPSMSGLAGGLGVLAASRKAMEAEKPEAFLLAESGGPPFFRSSNFTYNWAFLFNVAPTLLDEGSETWVPRASQWLQQQRYSFPRGAKQIMTLENHDTVRAQLKFGVGTHRALLALAALSDATPFLYHDQEIGYGPYLKRLFEVRRAHDELTLGDADYTSFPASDPSVLTVMREKGTGTDLPPTSRGELVPVPNSRASLVAINFSGRPVECTVDLSQCPGLDPQQSYSLWEAFEDRAVEKAYSRRPEDMRAIGLSLPPYAPAVITFRPPQEAPKPPPPRYNPQPPVVKATVVRSGDSLTVTNAHYTLRVGPQTGGLIESLAAGERTLLGPVRFGTAGRRLWLGGDLALGPGTFRGAAVTEDEGELNVAARGTVTRNLGGSAEPAMDYEAAYVCDEWRVIRCSVQFRPRVNIEGVLGSLATTLTFPEATRWAARTFEGLLYDDLVPRRLDDQPYHSMYVRPHSDRLFSSESLPLDPDTSFLGAEWPDGTALLVRDIRGWVPGVPDCVRLKERLGDSLGLHARLLWADGSKPLTLRRGEVYELSYALEVLGSGGDDIEAVAAAGASATGIPLRTEGSRYIVETPEYRAVIGRSQGGSLENLTLKAAGADAVRGTNVYSDYGIYADWTDPSGNKHRTNALSQLDIECVPTIERGPDRLHLTFEGVFRDASWSGRPIPEPRTQYRVAYEFTDEPFVSVECSARPQMTKAQVQAFLAQTLGLPNAGPWAVYRGEPPRLIALGKSPGPGDRVWQSATEPLTDADRPRLFFEAPGPQCVEFSGFAGLEEVQNLFYLQGKVDSTLFVAFLDGQPTDLAPRWRTVRYRITLHRGALGEVLKVLGLPAPQEGAR